MKKLIIIAFIEHNIIKILVLTLDTKRWKQDNKEKDQWDNNEKEFQVSHYIILWLFILG